MGEYHYGNHVARTLIAAQLHRPFGHTAHEQDIALYLPRDQRVRPPLRYEGKGVQLPQVGILSRHMITLVCPLRIPAPVPGESHLVIARKSGVPAVCGNFGNIFSVKLPRPVAAFCRYDHLVDDVRNTARRRRRYPLRTRRSPYPRR